MTPPTPFAKKENVMHTAPEIVALDVLLKRKDVDPDVKAVAAAVQAVHKYLRELHDHVDQHQHDAGIHHSHTHAHA
jgi:hypothetical protein